MGQVDEENLEDCPTVAPAGFPDDRIVCMAGRGSRAQSFPTIGASEYTGAESSSGARHHRRIPVAPNNLGAQFDGERLGAVLESLRRLVPQGDAALVPLAEEALQLYEGIKTPTQQRQVSPRHAYNISESSLPNALRDQHDLQHKLGARNQHRQPE